MNIITVTAEFLAGTDIKQAISQAKKFSEDNNNCNVKFSFNGTRCEINSSSNVDIAAKQYHQICIAKVTGIEP